MNEWTWGYWIWGFRWLLISFLGFELASKDLSGLAPWPSLSATWQHSIKTYPVMGPLTFGCFIFLGVHWIYGRRVWQSVLFGLIVAGVAHWMDHRL